MTKASNALETYKKQKYMHRNVERKKLKKKKKYDNYENHKTAQNFLHAGKQCARIL